MFSYELRVLAVDVSTEVPVKPLIAEITEPIHDLIQSLFLGDLIFQHLFHQHRVLGIGRIPQLADSFDYIPKFSYCVLIVIHLSVLSWFPDPAALLLSFL